MLSLHDKISIVQLCFFVPFLVTCIFLGIRHGFQASGAWYYIGILSLMRIVGGSLELATIRNPTSIGLAVGAQTLQNIGLSPLLLISVSIVGRVLESIPDSLRPRLPNKLAVQGLYILILNGLILLIVGGTKIGDQIGADVANGRSFANYTIPGVTKGGVGCLIAAYVLIVLFLLRLRLLHATTARGAIACTEMRLLTAAMLALPFVLVRLTYSIITTYDPSNKNFRQYGGSHDAPYYVIGMCTVMEIICVLIFLGTGLTLPYIPRDQRKQNNQHGQQSSHCGRSLWTKRGRRESPASDDNANHCNSNVEDMELATR